MAGSLYAGEAVSKYVVPCCLLKASLPAAIEASLLYYGQLM